MEVVWPEQLRARSDVRTGGQAKAMHEMLDRCGFQSGMSGGMLCRSQHSRLAVPPPSECPISRNSYLYHKRIWAMAAEAGLAFRVEYTASCQQRARCPYPFRGEQPVAGLQRIQDLTCD